MYRAPARIQPDDADRRTEENQTKVYNRQQYLGRRTLPLSVIHE